MDRPIASAASRVLVCRLWIALPGDLRERRWVLGPVEKWDIAEEQADSSGACWKLPLAQPARLSSRRLVRTTLRPSAASQTW